MSFCSLELPGRFDLSIRLAVSRADGTVLELPGLSKCCEFITRELWAVIRHNFVWASVPGDSWVSRWRFLPWCQVACPLPRSYCSSQPLSGNSYFWTQRDLFQPFPRDMTVPHVAWGFLLLAHFKCLADFACFYLLLFFADILGQKMNSRTCLRHDSFPMCKEWSLFFICFCRLAGITTLCPLTITPSWTVSSSCRLY